tara:strand:+ start:298 stop:474 length:177 start_codon:yes stop_codon:yes gene_type:complete
MSLADDFAKPNRAMMAISLVEYEDLKRDQVILEVLALLSKEELLDIPTAHILLTTRRS